jgi:hypothetical protein
MLANWKYRGSQTILLYNSPIDVSLCESDRPKEATMPAVSGLRLDAVAGRISLIASKASQALMKKPKDDADCSSYLILKPWFTET